MYKLFSRDIFRCRTGVLYCLSCWHFFSRRFFHLHTLFGWVFYNSPIKLKRGHHMPRVRSRHLFHRFCSVMYSMRSWKVLDGCGNDPGLDVPFLWLHGQCVHFRGPGRLCGEHDRAKHVHGMCRGDLLCGPEPGVPVVHSGQVPKLDGTDHVLGLRQWVLEVGTGRRVLHPVRGGQVQHADWADKQRIVSQLCGRDVRDWLWTFDVFGVRGGQGAVGLRGGLVLELRCWNIYVDDWHNCVFHLRRWHFYFRSCFLGLQLVPCWLVPNSSARHSVSVMLCRDVYAAG